MLGVTRIKSPKSFKALNELIISKVEISYDRIPIFAIDL
jgi:hypothetical protein